MDIKAQYDSTAYKDNGKAYLTFEIDGLKEAHLVAAKLRELKEKELSLSVGVYRNKRSLDANAYMWMLCKKIAIVLNTSKDEIYLQMLQRYGVFTHGIFTPKAAERVKQEWRTVINLGEVTVNGKIGIQLQLYYGSSTFDTKEMSVLINGIVDECKQLDIETKPQEEIKSLCEEWGK